MLSKSAPPSLIHATAAPQAPLHGSPDVVATAKLIAALVLQTAGVPCATVTATTVTSGKCPKTS
eukprot:5515590-Amphidinium_carterae.1